MTTWNRGQFVNEGSFNLRLYTQLSAKTASFFTAWVTAPPESAYLRFDWGADVPINAPCFSVAHLGQIGQITPNMVTNPTGGAGAYVEHLTEVSVWHHRYEPPPRLGTPGTARANWQLEMRQMRDMVVQVLRTARGRFPLLDLNVSTDAPFTTAGRCAITDIREAPVPGDAGEPNPALERIRLLCRWTSLESV